MKKKLKLFNLYIYQRRWSPPAVVRFCFKLSFTTVCNLSTLALYCENIAKNNSGLFTFGSTKFPAVYTNFQSLFVNFNLLEFLPILLLSQYVRIEDCCFRSSSRPKSSKLAKCLLPYRPWFWLILLSLFTYSWERKGNRAKTAFFIMASHASGWFIPIKRTRIFSFMCFSVLPSVERSMKCACWSRKHHFLGCDSHNTIN